MIFFYQIVLTELQDYYFCRNREVSLSSNNPSHILPQAPLNSFTEMSNGEEQNVEAGCTQDHNTSTQSLKESDESGDGTGVNDTPSSSLTLNTFWRDQKFWIQIAIFGTMQLYVFSLI